MPSLPEVLTKVQKAMQSEDVSIEQIANLIGHDTALVAQVLKVVNSAYYSLPKEIVEVKMAIAFLGINEVYRIILTLSAINSLADGDTKEFSKIWLHSLYTALCARHLSQKFEPFISPGELWTAGLLHDIGKLVYLKFFPEHFKALAKHSEESGVTFSEAERHFDLPTSAYFGVLLSERWRLPAKVREACRCHSLDDLKKQETLDPFTKMICLANLFAVFTQDNLSSTSKQEIGETLRSELGLEENAFLIILGEATEWRIEAENLLSNLK